MARSRRCSARRAAARAPCCARSPGCTRRARPRSSARASAGRTARPATRCRPTGAASVFVFQDYALFPHLTVREQVGLALGNRPAGCPPGPDRRTAGAGAPRRARRPQARDAVRRPAAARGPGPGARARPGRAAARRAVRLRGLGVARCAAARAQVTATGVVAVGRDRHARFRGRRQARHRPGDDRQRRSRGGGHGGGLDGERGPARPRRSLGTRGGARRGRGGITTRCDNSRTCGRATCSFRCRPSQRRSRRSCASGSPRARSSSPASGRRACRCTT